MRTQGVFSPGDLSVSPRSTWLSAARLCPAALAFAGFTAAATLIGHSPRTFEGADFDRQLTAALGHLTIVGGLIRHRRGPVRLPRPQPKEHAS